MFNGTGRLTIFPSNFKIHRSLFAKLSLIPFFALIGLGCDSLSSSCYGPEEIFIHLLEKPYLSIFVALISVLTIWIISISYCQIIELFPNGGGGYVVASKLLSSFWGAIAGSALLVDYVLTITISVAAGIDAFLSLLPTNYYLSIGCKFIALGLLSLINLRGVKESILPWVPIFIAFALTHLIAFGWSFVTHFFSFSTLIDGTINNTMTTVQSIGWTGLVFIVLKAYSVGAGTYTGIEAVSNGTNLFREPKVANAKRTMIYMAIGLSIAVVGLLLSYIFYGVSPVFGKTLNAVLFAKIGEQMGGITGQFFEALTLFSETALLFVAAETGFLGGPRVLANMSIDHWLPNKFTALSDTFVIRDGILMMGLASFGIMYYTDGSVATLVILYSLSVFISFTLSQLGMVIHWWNNRKRAHHWLRSLLVNGIGCIATLFIFLSLTYIKFFEGAWFTLLIVLLLLLICSAIQRYYRHFSKMLTALNNNVPIKANTEYFNLFLPGQPQQTAVFLFGGLKGLGLRCISEVITLFGQNFQHYVFLHVGVIDAGNFKGVNELSELMRYTEIEAAEIVLAMQRKGYSAEAMVSLGLDLVDEIMKLAEEAHLKYPSCTFFGGQLVFSKETLLTRWLHNQTLHAISRQMHERTYNFVTIPIYIDV